MFFLNLVSSLKKLNFKLSWNSMITTTTEMSPTKSSSVDLGKWNAPIVYLEMFEKLTTVIQFILLMFRDELTPRRKNMVGKAF